MLKMDAGLLRDFAERYTAAWCSQAPASVAAFFSPQGSLSVNGGAAAVGRIAISEVAQGFMTAFPDLEVLLDEVVLEARAKFPRLTTVLMTAAPEAISLTALGLDGYLAKPFRSNALVVHTLQAALDRRAQAEKRQELEAQLQSAVAQLTRRDR